MTLFSLLIGHRLAQIMKKPTAPGINKRNIKSKRRL
jgi:hypothetical protein